MSVEQVRTNPAVRGPVRAVRPLAPYPPSQRPAPRETSALCLVIPEIADGEARRSSGSCAGGSRRVPSC